MRNEGKDSDRDLRSRFESLRRFDAARTGRFEAAWSAARSRQETPRSALPRRRRLLLTATSAVIAVAAAVILVRRPPRPSVEEAIAQARELQSWSAPTDSLLTAVDVANPQTLPNPEPTNSPGASPGASSPHSP